MAEATGTPSAWIGQEVHLRYAHADRTRDVNCILDEVNDQGVSVSEEGDRYFYPWSNVVRIGLGHKQARGTRKTRVR
jgi:hypothetical protein